MVCKVRVHAVTMHNLEQLTVPQNGAIFRAENKECVGGALDMVNRNWLGLLGYGTCGK